MNTFSFHRNSLYSFSPSPPSSPHYFSLFEPQLSSIRWVETFLSSPSFYAWRKWGTWTVTNLPKVTLSRFLDPNPMCVESGKVGSFPTPTKNFPNTSCMSCNSTPFWHYLSRRVSDSTGYRLSSTRLPYSVAYFRWQSHPQVVTCTSDRLAINQKFPNPPPQFQLIS